MAAPPTGRAYVPLQDAIIDDVASAAHPSSVDIRDDIESSAFSVCDAYDMVARPAKACRAIPPFWFTIPEGYYGLVTRRGARADFVVPTGTGIGSRRSSPVWPCGLHLGPPWLRVSHLVTRGTILHRDSISGCMTKDGVSIRIDVTIVMRVMGDDDLATPGDDPNNVYKLVHEVTPFGLRTLLRTALSIEARKLARSVNHADVLGLRNFAAVSEMTTATANTRGAKRVSFSSNVTGRGGMADALGEEDGSSGERDERDDDVPVPTMMDAMRAVLNQQFNELGIEILDVILRNIALPDRVQSRLTHKTLMICDDVIEGMQRRIDMQSIQHDEEIKLKRMHESDRTRLMKEGEYDAMLARLELDALRAEGERAIRSIESQMSIDVELVKAENALTVQRIEDEARLETERIRVQSNSDVEVELAATRNELDVISAKGHLEVARNIAKGEKAIFKAEGKCAPLNRRLNDHLTSMNFLKAQSALASNGGLAFVGKMGGGTANSVFLTDAALSTIPEKLEGLSHFIISEAIVESDPFTNTARRRNGTQSLPDARTLHRRRVHEIIAERKGRVFASR